MWHTEHDQNTDGVSHLHCQPENKIHNTLYLYHNLIGPSPSPWPTSTQASEELSLLLHQWFWAIYQTLGSGKDHPISLSHCYCPFSRLKVSIPYLFTSYQRYKMKNILFTVVDNFRMRMSHQQVSSTSFGKISDKSRQLNTRSPCHIPPTPSIPPSADSKPKPANVWFLRWLLVQHNAAWITDTDD